MTFIAALRTCLKRERVLVRRAATERLSLGAGQRGEPPFEGNGGRLLIEEGVAKKAVAIAE